MIRLLLTHLALSFVLLGVIYTSGISAAFAQSSASHKIERLKNDIKTAGLEVPDTVLRQIEDVYIRIENLKAKEAVQMGKVVDTYTSDAQLNTGMIDYYEGDDYYALGLQKNELNKEGRALLRPYLEKTDPVSLISAPDFSSMTVQEIINFSVEMKQTRLEREGIYMSQADLLEYENILRKSVPARQKHGEFIREGRAALRSPEFKQLHEEIKAFNKDERFLLEPYYKQLRVKQNARKKLRNAFSHQFSFRYNGSGARKIRTLEHLQAKYKRYDFVISNEDIKLIKNLEAENRKLAVESKQLQGSAIRLGSTIKKARISGESQEEFIKRDMDNKKQREEIGKLREDVNKRFQDNKKRREDILRPYEERFEAALPKR